MTKLYSVTFNHTFAIRTSDIREVILNYEFPDFTNCESIVDEPEYDGGSETYIEIDEDWNEVLA